MFTYLPVCYYDKHGSPFEEQSTGHSGTQTDIAKGPLVADSNFGVGSEQLPPTHLRSRGGGRLMLRVLQVFTAAMDQTPATNRTLAIAHAGKLDYR